MRKDLRVISGERKGFSGTFVRFGLKSGWRGRTEKTVLLRDVCDAETGKVVADHLWFNLTQGFASLNMAEGEVVEFKARVRPYEKGYFGKREDVFIAPELDYKLGYPTQFKKRVS